MGKLADLWARYNEAKEADKQTIREEIWTIEDWMISKNFKDKRTDFNKIQSKDERTASRLGRFSNIRMRQGIKGPPGSKYGRDRCGACKYNFAPFCNSNDRWAHTASV